MKITVAALLHRLSQQKMDSFITLVDSEGYNEDLKLFAGDVCIAEQAYVDEESNGVFEK